MGHEPSKLVVEGKATVQSRPESAKLRFEVVVIGADPHAAVDEAAKRQQAVIAALRAAVDGLEITAPGVTVGTRYRQDSNDPPYEANAAIAVRTSRLDALGALASAAFAAGATTAAEVELYGGDPDTDKEAALAQATKQARSKAGVIAEALGLAVGNVIEVSEEELFFGRFDVECYAPDACTPVPAQAEYALGGTSTAASVKAVFELVARE